MAMTFGSSRCFQALATHQPLTEFDDLYDKEGHQVRNLTRQDSLLKREMELCRKQRCGLGSF